jgi:hypothetical protein
LSTIVPRRFAAPAFFLAALVAALAILAQGTAAARTGQSGDVVVTVAQSGTPVAGAFVSLTGSAGQYAGVTNTSGLLTLSAAADGTYGLNAAAPGAQVASASVTVAGSTVNSAVSLVSSGTRFTGLGAFGGQVGTVVSDGGKSGLFYANTTSSPSLYRTADHGGSWVPVTVSSDDADDGIDGKNAASIPATSGYPGEIAAVVGSKLYYSRDFGVSWRSFNLPLGFPTHSGQLFWSHVGTTSKLFLVDTASTTIYWTDMPTFTSSSVSPAFAAMTSSYKASANDKVWIANGSSAPVVAVAVSSGAGVTLYSVGTTPSSSDPGASVVGSGPGTAPTFVRIGGPTTGGAIGTSTNQPPNTILVYSNDGNGSAVMTKYSGSLWLATPATQFKDNNDNNTSGTFNNGPNSCGGQPGAVGSIAPIGGAGTVAQCWVTHTIGALEVRNVSGINNNTGVAFDAGYDGTTNFVLLSGDGNYGLRKAAKTTTNRPDFAIPPSGAAWSDTFLATAGTGATSGGIAVNGMNAAVVKDTDFGPSSSEIAVILSFTGGNRVLASKDAGATWQTINASGGNAVSWWRSATSGESWIMSARTGAGNLLYALNVASSGLASGATMTYLNNTALSDFGLSGAGENADVPAIVGLPGTNVAFAAVTNGTSTALAKLTLSGSGSPTVAISDARPGERAATANPAISFTGQATALAYCPTGSAASVADVLYAAVKATTDNGTDGKLVRVTGASTASPAATTLSATGDFRDVRVQCSEGVVFAATYAQSGQSGLRKSTDGTTFNAVTIGSNGQVNASFQQVETFAVNPSSASEVVAVSRSGDVTLSKDGGTTWTTQNDTSATAGKSFGSEKPGDVTLPPTSSAGRSGQATVTSTSALLGSGGGLYSAAVRGGDTPAAASPYRVVLPMSLRAAAQ